MAAGMAASRPGSQPASRPGSQPASQSKSRAGRRGLPVVVALGAVDPALVEGVLDGYCRLVAAPGDAGVLTPHLMGLSRRATAATFAAAAVGVLDVLAGREPQAVADPAWRTRAPKEIPARHPPPASRQGIPAAAHATLPVRGSRAGQPRSAGPGWLPAQPRYALPWLRAK
jgi:hypothetical protein